MRSMVALIDANVIINYMTGREDNEKESSRKVIEMCARNQILGYIAFHSLSTIWYVFRKRPKDETRKWLKQICGILKVTGASHEEVVNAIDKESFTDFEDCLQDECADSCGADYIVTRNTKDFENSKVRAIAPDEFLKLIEK